MQSNILITYSMTTQMILKLYIEVSVVSIIVKYYTSRHSNEHIVGQIQSILNKSNEALSYRLH